MKLIVRLRIQIVYLNVEIVSCVVNGLDQGRK